MIGATSFGAGRAVPVKEPSGNGKAVVYWMQGAFRTSHNPSLECAVEVANRTGRPLIVLVVLDLGYPEANARSFKFFLEGLVDVREGLARRGIALHLRKGKFEKILAEYAPEAHMLVSDAAYLPAMREVREKVYRSFDSGILEVEPNVLVPVKAASGRMEYGAYTLRPKIRRLAPIYERDFSDREYRGERLDDELDFDPSDHARLLKGQVEDVQPCGATGGSRNALRTLGHFLEKKYPVFAAQRGDPASQAESDLSPYLHFGHISPVQILEGAQESGASNGNYGALFEQLIVRRELAHNFTLYARSLVSPFDFIPSWAAETLKSHEGDRREYVYSLGELEGARTHDIYWNAAQSELLTRGKIHNYMRMYWGKKIIEWSEGIEDALLRPPKRGSVVNVLNHMFGYFSQRLTEGERRFFSEAVENYRKGIAPLIVSINLVRSYAIRFGIDYLLRQSLLEPYPLELMEKPTYDEDRDYWRF